MKSAFLAGVIALVLSAAGAAHAEKWVYYPVPGGALAYETDGKKVDVKTGLYGGDGLIFYFVPQAMGAKSYSVIIERMEFECRGDRYRTFGTAYFDEKGDSLGQLAARDWMPVPTGAPPSVFRRIFCANDRPPTAKEAPNRDALMTALHALPPTSSKSKVTLPTGPIVIPPAAAK
jgi:hypothetical protein